MHRPHSPQMLPLITPPTSPNPLALPEDDSRALPEDGAGVGVDGADTGGNEGGKEGGCARGVEVRVVWCDRSTWETTHAAWGVRAAVAAGRAAGRTVL